MTRLYAQGATLSIRRPRWFPCSHADDAIVVLVGDSGGSGSFLYLAAVLNRDGSPENVVIQSLGDRGQVERLSIKSGQIVIEMLAHGPDDPMCCPTQKVTLTYRLKGEELVKVSQGISAP